MAPFCSTGYRWRSEARWANRAPSPRAAIPAALSARCETGRSRIPVDPRCPDRLRPRGCGTGATHTALPPPRAEKNDVCGYKLRKRSFATGPRR